MKTLIEIHVLQNFAPSNLNRDDTGAPKDALFGGRRRARVSSQCLKRSVRKHFESKLEQGFFSAQELAVRTKRVYDAVASVLQGKRDREEALAKAERALSYVKLKAAKDDSKTEYLLFLGQNEINGLAAAIDEHWDEIKIEESGNEKSGKKAKKAAASDAPKEVKARIEAVFEGGKAVDLALFGRMLADMPEHNQDAACQVAHAISTHAVEREFDFYTAVDDLKPEDTAGADMMGTVEFNSACFYRYAVVDWEQLTKNLGGDADLAAKGLRAFIEGFVIAEPTGKQNTFAAHNPPEFVAVSVRKNTAARSLANAFETPVYAGRNESLTGKSAGELVAKATALQAAYGGEASTLVLDLVGADLSDFGNKVDSLAKLIDGSMAQV